DQQNWPVVDGVAAIQTGCRSGRVGQLAANLEVAVFVQVHKLGIERRRDERPRNSRRHWSIATEQRQHHLPRTSASADGVGTSQQDAFTTSANVTILPDDRIE